MGVCPVEAFAFQPKPSGNTPRVPAPPTLRRTMNCCARRGSARTPPPVPTRPPIPFRSNPMRRSRWAAGNRIGGVCTTCSEMYGSGPRAPAVPTRLMPVTAVNRKPPPDCACCAAARLSIPPSLWDPAMRHAERSDRRFRWNGFRLAQEFRHRFRRPLPRNNDNGILKSTGRGQSLPLAAVASFLWEPRREIPDQEDLS